MQTNAMQQTKMQTPTPDCAEALPPLHGEFPGEPLQPGRRFLAIPETNSYVRRHLSERSFADEGTPAHTSAFLAVGRYDWLLEAGREALKGVLTASALVTLLNVFGYEALTPCTIANLGDELEEYFGPECTDDLGGCMRELVETVRALSPLQRCALADIIERIVEGARQGTLSTVDEAAQRMGLVLK